MPDFSVLIVHANASADDPREEGFRAYAIRNDPHSERIEALTGLCMRLLSDDVLDDDVENIVDKITYDDTYYDTAKRATYRWTPETWDARVAELEPLLEERELHARLAARTAAMCAAGGMTGALHAALPATY